MTKAIFADCAASVSDRSFGKARLASSTDFGSASGYWSALASVIFPSKTVMDTCTGPNGVEDTLPIKDSGFAGGVDDGVGLGLGL